MTFDAVSLGLIGSAGLAIAGAAAKGVKSFNEYVDSQTDLRIAEREELQKAFDVKLDSKLDEAKRQFAKEIADVKVADASASAASNLRIERLESSLKGVRTLLYGAITDLALIPGTQDVRARLKGAADQL